MGVSGQLDELRAALPGCNLVLFGDLSSKITLCVSASDRYPQEKLDALCATAGDLLDGPAAQSSAGALGLSDGSGLDQAIILSPVDLQLFLRSPVDKADVLCCVCSLGGDVQRAIEQAHSSLISIAGNQ